MMGCVTIVKINAITVPEDSGDELGRRFAARAGAVDDQDGFEGFELLRPTDGRTTLIELTAEGRTVAKNATAALNSEVFSQSGFSSEDVAHLIRIRADFRRHAGDFSG